MSNCSRENGCSNCYQMSLSKGGDIKAELGTLLMPLLTGVVAQVEETVVEGYMMSPSPSWGVLSSPVGARAAWAVGSGLSLKTPAQRACCCSWARSNSWRSMLWVCRW